jgi:hypothetical protein
LGAGGACHHLLLLLLLLELCVRLTWGSGGRGHGPRLLLLGLRVSAHGAAARPCFPLPLVLLLLLLLQLGLCVQLPQGAPKTRRLLLPDLCVSNKG